MKTKLIILCLLIVLIFSSCVNFRPLNIRGLLESDNPSMRIEIVSNSVHGYIGEYKQKNGDVVKITFEARKGDFKIYEFQEDDDYVGKDIVLFEGEYRVRGKTLILKCDNGDEIILKKIADLPEPKTQSNY